MFAVQPRDRLKMQVLECDLAFQELIVTAIETLPAPELRFSDPTDDKWERERQAFVRMLPALQLTQRDQYVAVHQGQVIASGPDKIAVALQAYREYGQVPIYVGLVSDTPPLPARMPSPRTPRH